jgi:hypothetical protein
MRRRQRCREIGLCGQPKRRGALLGAKVGRMCADGLAAPAPAAPLFPSFVPMPLLAALSPSGRWRRVLSAALRRGIKTRHDTA